MISRIEKETDKQNYLLLRRTWKVH